MNRTPGLWANPRAILPWVSKRKEEVANVTNSTFANVALSSRLSQNPLRFYASGRESVYNMWQLVHEIKNGEHPCSRKIRPSIIRLFHRALLSQVLLLANPDKMFTDTRLFMFCGGSIFSEMDGNARDIMDKEAFARYAITSGMISWRIVRFPPRSRMIFWSKPLRPWYVRMCYEITGSRSSNGLAIVFGRSH